MWTARLALLLWAFLTHLAGIYLFTRGFLLTRLSLPNISACPECALNRTHSRAIVLVIDSLRFDFISPHPPHPPNPYHHNVLTLPRDLTATRPRHSFIFNAYSDPPTTTLQRIKGITTGSLPTFVDLGNNFGGSEVAEDSILKQLKSLGKKLAFMGDDTWLSVFPSTFSPNMTFPFDSFNVEDLHTVDEGVISHLFPLLDDPSKPFDLLVGHFLGVDHVGHRVGPDHPSMKAKLQQMNDVLKRVVEKIDKDTLLVVLGDHGMDRSGDHGGDGVLETSAGMWVYSKGFPLFNSTRTLPPGLLQHRTFPGSPVRHRVIQQIDILPSLALLLGVPIPYNNLGMVIPELFWLDRAGRLLERALEINGRQIMNFLETYRGSTLGGELDEAWASLESAYKFTQTVGGSVAAVAPIITSNGIIKPSKTSTATPPIVDEQKFTALVNFNRSALNACRAIWAQFNPILMSFGLATLAMCLCASWAVHSGYSSTRTRRDEWLARLLVRSLGGALVGAGTGALSHITLSSLSFIPDGVSLPHCILFGASIASSTSLIVLSPPSLPRPNSLPYILILHSLAFLSNSFTFWEDRIVPFLLISSILPYLRSAFQRTTPPVLRNRILTHSLLFSLSVRLMAISTICREEQQPYCRVTFFASSSVPSPPQLVLCLILPVAVGLPYVIARFLQLTSSSASNNNTAATRFLRYVLTPTLVAGTSFWLVEWVDSTAAGWIMEKFGSSAVVALRRWRTWFAWAAIGWVAGIGGVVWWWRWRWRWPSSFDSNTTSNIFGAPYLIFWTIFFGIVYICTQLTGQAVLALCAIALLSFLELLDGTRQAKALADAAAFSKHTSSTSHLTSASHDDDDNDNDNDNDDGNKSINPTTTTVFQFSDITPPSLLGLLAFYGTGHQSVVSSIQWKSAFILSSTVVYPLSVLTVVLNSIGPVFLVAGLGAGLVGIWRRRRSSRGRGRGLEDTERKKALSEGSPNGHDDDDNHHHHHHRYNNNNNNTSEGDDDDDNNTTIDDLTLASLAVTIYYLTLLLGASLGAAILRRHLMVWKVFAPRFMTAVLELVAVDVGVLIGAVGVVVGGGVGGVARDGISRTAERERMT